MLNYDKNYWAKRAAQYNKTSWVKNEDLIESFLAMLPKQNFDSILEIGIGTGAVAEIVANKIGHLTGIDISQEMISQINNPEITAVMGDAHNLLFDDNTFDLIYMRNVIHYIDNPELSFSEVYRCLKKGGYFLFSQIIPPDDSISEEYDWLVGRDIHYPTRVEITNWMKELHIKDINQHILTSQSIMNWLDNTCSDEFQKKQAIERHRKTSNTYKSLVNYYEKKDDIFVDIKHLLIIGIK